MVKCLAQGHKRHGRGQDSNPHSDDSAIKTQVRCTKPLATTGEFEEVWMLFLCVLTKLQWVQMVLQSHNWMQHRDPPLQTYQWVCEQSVVVLLFVLKTNELWKERYKIANYQLLIESIVYHPTQELHQPMLIIKWTNYYLQLSQSSIERISHGVTVIVFTYPLHHKGTLPNTNNVSSLEMTNYLKTFLFQDSIMIFCGL